MARQRQTRTDELKKKKKKKKRSLESVYIDTLIYLMHKSTMPNFQNDAKNFRLEINVASIGTIMIRDVVLIKQHSK